MDTKKITEEIAGAILEANPYHDQRGKFTSKGGRPSRALAMAAQKVATMNTTDDAAREHGTFATHDVRRGVSTIHGPGGVGNWKDKIVVSHETAKFMHLRRAKKMVGGIPSEGREVGYGRVWDLPGYLAAGKFGD